MPSACSANLGESSFCNNFSVSLVCASVRALNTAEARSNSTPLFSKATIVFSKVGASLLFVIAAIRSFCKAIPLRRAGR